MAQEKPLISVIMAAYNVERFIGAAIESVLAQTYSNWELIVANDASPDKVREIVEGYAKRDGRIRLINLEKNSGQAIARNRAVEKASGEYLAILDADDLALPNRFETQLAYFKAHPEVAILGSAAIIIDEHGKKLSTKIKTLTNEEIRFSLLLQSQFIHSSVMMKKSAFDELGGYRHEFVYAEDYDLWSRARDKGFIMANIAEPLISYRIQAQSVTMISKSQKIQAEHALRVNERNVSPFISIARPDLERLVNLVNNVTLSSRDTLTARKDYKRLIDAYIEKGTRSDIELGFINILRRDKLAHFRRLAIKRLFARA